MSKHCAIPGCRSTIRDCFMFSVGQNNSLAQWWTATPWYDGTGDVSISKDLMICLEHFNDDQIDKSISSIRLISNEVPSVNLPDSSISRVGNNCDESSQQAECSNLLLMYCRFCGKKQTEPIKNNLEDLVKSEDLLQLCLGRGRFLEGFPNGVCYDCLQIVEAMTVFIQHCEQAQEKLQKIFFGTSQQMVDSLAKNENEDQEDDQHNENCFEMPEAVMSLREESFMENDIKIEYSKTEFLENESEDKATVDVLRPSDIICTICNRTFNRKRALNAHMESIHEKKIFACPICGKTMGWRKTLQRHIKSHEENFQKHKCELCDKAFSRPSHLRLHMNKHTGMKIRCPLCLNGYRDRYKLAAHLIKAHNMDNDAAKTQAQYAVAW